MKSFLRFLSNHKLYAAIEVFGLSVAMAFVILLGAIIMEDNSCDDSLKVDRRTYLVYSDRQEPICRDVSPAFDACPEVEAYCQYTDNNACEIDGKYQIAAYFGDGFFDFFDFDLSVPDKSDLYGRDDVVLLSEDFAEEMFQTTDCAGRAIRIGKTDCVVTGTFKFPEKTTFTKVSIMRNLKVLDGSSFVLNFVKFHPGADLEGFKEKFAPLAKSHATVFNCNEVRLVKFRDIHFGKISTDSAFKYKFDNVSDFDLYRAFLFGCFFILLFAILNYISLTLAFSRFRLRELSIRGLLGSRKSSIVGRQILETSAFVVLSWGIAVLLASWLKNPVNTVFGVDVNPLDSPEQWLLSALFIITVSLIAGAVPALSVLKVKSLDVVRGEVRFKDRTVVGKLFIGLQAALSIAALAVATAFFLQTRMMIHTPMGYETDGIISVSGRKSVLPGEELSAGLTSLPCVERIGTVASLPSHGPNVSLSTSIGDDVVVLSIFTADTTALDMLGIRKTESLSEDGDYYLSEGLYQEWLSYYPDGSANEWVSLKGLVSDFRFGGLSGGKDYGFPIINIKGNNRIFLVKVLGDTGAATGLIRDKLQGMGFNAEEVEVRTLEDSVRENYTKERKYLTIIGVFAILCLLMTVLAIIALSSYWSRLQMKDTALRKVFGSTRSQTFLNAAKGFLIPVLIGIAIAVPCAWWVVGKWLGNYPEHIGNSPAIYLFSAAIVLIAVIASVSVQAVRLMNTTPAEVLKKE